MWILMMRIVDRITLQLVGLYYFHSLISYWESWKIAYKMYRLFEKAMIQSEKLKIEKRKVSRFHINQMIKLRFGEYNSFVDNIFKLL